MGMGGLDGSDGFADLAVVECFHVSGAFHVGTQCGGDAFVCWVVFTEPLSDAPLMTAAMRCLDSAGGFWLTPPW